MTTGPRAEPSSRATDAINAKKQSKWLSAGNNGSRPPDERDGPSLLDQLLDTLGIRWRPNPRRIEGLGVLVLGTLVTFLLMLLILTGVFWHDLEPVVKTLFNQGSDGGGGG